MSAGDDNTAESEQEFCIYCQERPAATVDHVFARAWFGTAKPKVWMTVPSCEECNQGRGDGEQRHMSADEEWLRTIIASEHNASKHPTAKRLIEGEIIRSFKRRPQFARRLVENARFVDAKTESGIVVPNQPAFALEDDRLNRVIRKMVRGLFYTYSFRRQDKGTPLPKEWPIAVSRIRTNEDFEKFDKTMDAWPLSLQWWSMGDEKAISYRGAIRNHESNLSIWIIVFYGAVAFLAHTIPPPGSPLAKAEPDLGPDW
jgi:hypothetical protein